MTLAEPTLVQSAQIVSAYEIQHGSALSADMTAATTYLELEDLDDFSDTGGEIYLASLETADQTSEPIAYVGLDRTLNRILLAAAWSADFPLFLSGDAVWISPVATERRADVALDGEEDQIVVARVPYSLAANIPLGVRDAHAGEWIRVRVTDYGYELDDATLEYPKTDPDSISIIDPDTGEEIGAIGGDAAFDTVTADEIISPSVPRRNWLSKLLYVDPVAGDDGNDGTAVAPLADLFERVVASGFGTSDSGHVWSTPQNQGNLADVDGTKARIRLNGGNQNTVGKSTFGPLDYEVVSVLNVGSPPTGGSADYGNLLRILDGTTYILGGINVSTSGVVLPVITTKNGGSFSQVATGASLGTYVGAALGAIDWNVRTQIQTNPDGGTDVRVKIWKTTDVEPDSWSVEWNETIGAFQNPNGAGFGARSGGSYTGNVIASWREIRAFSIAADGTEIDTAEGGVGPLASIGAAVEEIGEWNDADVRIVLNGTFDESVYLSGIAGEGRVFLDGAGVSTIYGIVKVYGVSQYVELRNVTLQDTGETGVSGTVEVRVSRYVELVTVKFQTNSQHSYNVHGAEGSVYRVADCQLSGATSYCTNAVEATLATLVNNSGSAPNGSYRCSQSTIWQDGTKPSGGTSALNGGQILGTITTSGGGTPPPTSNKVTKTYSPNGSRTWRPEWAWREDDRYVYQGEYQGSGGISRGCVFYGTKLNVAGKTADSGKIFVKRRSSGGASQDQAVYLFAHDLASQPNNDSAPAIKDSGYKLGTLAWGEGRWFDIPKAWVQSMLDGAGGRRGFGLYHASASPYVIAVAYNGGGDSWKVKFTYH